MFPSTRRGVLSLDALAKIVKKHAATAANTRPSLQHKRVTPHVLRHTAAMQLREARVDLSIIALWLGHESIETTQIYLDADLASREAAVSSPDLCVKAEAAPCDLSARLPWRPPWARGETGPGSGGCPRARWS
ncbi:MAG: tyrosine-type recombinase/integrase [Gemmatimonadetes bacterium]|nr:tyrosine-type recombinase/integrase [Gemmatimonadota bacterium]